jgi:hypothetical protein
MRTCFDCKNYKICAARIGVELAMRHVSVNIDSDDAPKKITDVFVTLAECCLDFTERPKANVTKPTEPQQFLP